MTKRELIEGTRRALAEFAALPLDEQFRRMVARGSINEKGEVLWGGRAENGEDGPKDEGQGRAASERAQTGPPCGSSSCDNQNGDMTKSEIIEQSRRALAAFAALPPEEQFRRLVARGVINEKGEVL
jgi:hypothetical protein